jgi:hypothetical protein
MTTSHSDDYELGNRLLLNLYSMTRHTSLEPLARSLAFECHARKVEHEHDPARVMDFILKAHYKFDSHHQFDLIDAPSDSSVTADINEFYRLRALALQSDPYSLDTLFRLKTILEEIIELGTYISLVLAESPSDLLPPPDLTAEGIEPNPGPESTYEVYIDPPARLNRYRADAKIPHKQRKEIQNEIKIYNRLLSEARRNRVKTSLIDYDLAQIGSLPISSEAPLLAKQIVPPKECSTCGKSECACMSKRLTTVATSFSIAQSIVKIVDIVAHWLTVNHAQMGLLSWATGAEPTIAKADVLITEATDRIQAIPSAESLRTMISETIKNVLDSDCGFLPITIRTILISLLTVTGLFIIYKMGVVAYNLIVLPTKMVLDSICHGEELLAAFKEHCMSSTNPQTLDTAQMGVQEIYTHLPSALALMSTLIVTFAVGKIPGRDNTAFGMLTKIGAVPRAAGGIAEIFTWAHTAVKVAWEWIKIKILGYDPDEFEGAIPVISKWMKDVEDLMYAPARAALCTTYEGRYKAMTLYGTGVNLLKQYHSALTPNLKVAMTKWLQEAARIKNLTELHYPETKAIRSVPLALWMVGESQIGKSRLQYLISTELCLEAGIQDAKDQLYPRNIEMEFWDNYQGQFVTIYDDFGQMKDSSANPNLEFFEIIRTVGPFPCPLHMADISQKGTTDFRSKVVIASTNAMNLRIESLTYPDAVWNRLTQSWYVEVKPAYLMCDENGNPILPHRLNIPKIIEDSPVLNGKKWAINPYIYDFIKFDARVRNQRLAATGTRIGWDAFIAILKADLNSRKDQGLALDDFLTEFIADRRKPRVGEPEAINAEPPVDDVAQIGDPIASTAHQSYAQCGIPPSYTLADFHLVLQQDPHPDYNISDEDLIDFRMLTEFEIDTLPTGTDPSTILLTTFEPTHFPVQTWQSAILYFYRTKNPARSQVDKTIDMVKKMAQRAYDRLAPAVRTFLEGLKLVFRKVFNSLKTYPKTAWFAFSTTLFFLDRWASDKNKQLEEERLRTKIYDELLSQRRLGKEDEINTAESDTRNHQPRVRPQPRTATNAKPTLVSSAEMGQSFGQLDVIAKVRRQQYHLTAVYPNGSRTECGTITNVVGQVYLMPNHFLLRFKANPPSEIVMVNHANTSVVLTRPYATWIDGPAVNLTDTDGLPRDICVFAIKEIHRGRDVINHFVTQEDLAKMMDRSFDAILSGIDMESNSPVPTSHGGQCSLLPESDVHSYALDGQVIRTSRVAVHKIPTKVGDCGKILSVNSDAVTGRIFAVHISGNKSGRNHAQVISREELRACIELLPSTAQCGHGFTNLKPSEDPFKCALLHLGDLPTKIAQSTKTSIVKSTLHGVIQEPITRPAVLRPKEVTIDGQTFIKDPLLEGAKKAGVNCGLIDPNILESAEIDVRNLIHSQLRPDGPEPRILTIEEAIKGIPNDELFAPINRTTSAGFPYTQQTRPPGFKGKTYWLGKGDEWDLETPQAKQLIDDITLLEDDCRNSRPTDILWIDTLKDERLPHEKVDIARTRVISNGPMHYNILFRMYFLSVMAHIRHNRILNGIGIGLNVWSSEWHFLALHLLSVSPLLIDGDFKNYDGTLLDQIMWAVFRIFDSFYDDEHTETRYNIWHPACYATRYNQGAVYQCTHSLPSGMPATAEANSTYGLIVFRCAYIILAREHGHLELANMQSFNENVRIVTYGDDNLLSISPLIIDWFNMHTLVKCLAKFGMTYTTAQKTEIYDSHRSIDEVSFLKRFFKKIDTGYGMLPIYTCPAPIETRLEILNWTKFRKLGAQPEEADTITTVLQELAVHGKEVYDRESRRVVKAAIDYGLTGFTQLSLMDYLTKIMTGDLPRSSPPQILSLQCDLTTDRQNSDVLKAPSTAAEGRGVAIQPYPPGSPEAFPQYPGDRQSGC